MSTRGCTTHAPLPVLYLLILFVFSGLFTSLYCQNVSNVTDKSSQNSALEEVSLPVLLAQAVPSTPQGLAKKDEKTRPLAYQSHNTTSSFWKHSFWAGAAVSVLAFGTGVYFNQVGKTASDDYTSATTTEEANASWKKAEDNFNTRNLIYIGAGTTTAYTLFSYYKHLKAGDKK